MGKPAFRVLRLSSVLLLGIGLVYTGNRVLSPRPKPREAEPEQAAGPAETNGQHEALLLNEALKKKPGHAPVLLRLAQMAEASGNHSQAIHYLQDILRTEPHNLDAQLELGRILFQTGDVQGSIAQTKRILVGRPDQADALYNLGAIYANLNDRTLALQYWNRLIATSPGSDSAEKARRLMPQLPAAVNPVR